ncbi:MAG: hypothetical protein U9N40_03745 [Euryarchaeota archaeon]|nr:hypothetical protein [Euryarchaeota archaeon]
MDKRTMDNKTKFFLAIAILSVVFLLMLTPYVKSPELYTIKTNAETQYHFNPQALKLISQEKTAPMIPLMQDFLGLSGTIVLDIKVKNFENAEDNLKAYAGCMKQFDNLVVNLDMSESELGDFREQNANNYESLRQLLEDSIDLEELNKLEIKYQDKDDPSLYYSIAYEGESLRNKIKGEYSKYTSNSEEFQSSAGKFELNTTRHEESVTTFEEIVSVVDDGQDKRVDELENQSTEPDYKLSLAVSPDTGTYADSLLFSGNISDGYPYGKQVTLFIDSREYSFTETNENGTYQLPYKIGKISGGLHLAYTLMEETYSNVLLFSLNKSETNINLTCQVTPNGEVVTCSGSLVAETTHGIIPVSEAPVTISVDGNETANFTTDSKGIYLGSVTVPADSREVVLQASFSGKGFPLKSSKSDSVSVDTGSLVTLILTLIVGGACILFSGGAGLYYIRRFRRGKDKKDSTDTASTDIHGFTPATEIPETKLPAERKYEEENVREQYSVLLNTGEQKQAAKQLATTIFEELEIISGVHFTHSATARERALAIAGSAAHKSVEAFIYRFEEVIYGGIDPVYEGKDTLLSAWEEALSALGSVVQ